MASLPTIDELRSDKYTFLDKERNNTYIFENLKIGYPVYYIEKGFKRNEKDWSVIDCIVSRIDTINKRIYTNHPGGDGRMYIGIIYYGVGDRLNLVDYYVKI